MKEMRERTEETLHRMGIHGTYSEIREERKARSREKQNRR